MRKVVLILEDGEDDVRALKTVLRDGNLSHPVTCVADGKKARHFFMTDVANGDAKVGIVLINILSSRVCGLEFLDWLRGQHCFSELLVVALTERNQLKDVVDACERGAHTFWVKPVHTEDVKALARNYPAFCAAD